MNDRDRQTQHDPAVTVRLSSDRRARRTTGLYQTLALFLVAASAGYLLMPQPTPAPPPTKAEPRLEPPATRINASAVPKSARNAASDSQAANAQPAPVASSGRLPDPQPRADDAPKEGTQDPTLDLSAYVPPGQAPTAAELIEALHERGIYDGIAAFPPPGTSPPLEGLAVPEDYALPEGYVRHYQATDDGQRIEPILMFSDDYDFFDEHGNPLPIPEDRVVPPHLAPPGLPISNVEIPQARNR